MFCSRWHTLQTHFLICFVENYVFYVVVEVSEEIELVYKQQHILWSNVFKHLGSHVSTYELSSCLVDCIVANADKGNCAVRSARLS